MDYFSANTNKHKKKSENLWGWTNKQPTNVKMFDMWHVKRATHPPVFFHFLSFCFKCGNSSGNSFSSGNSINVDFNPISFRFVMWFDDGYAMVVDGKDYSMMCLYFDAGSLVKINRAVISIFRSLAFYCGGVVNWNQSLGSAKQMTMGDGTAGISWQ